MILSPDLTIFPAAISWLITKFSFTLSFASCTSFKTNPIVCAVFLTSSIFFPLKSGNSVVSGPLLIISCTNVPFLTLPDVGDGSCDITLPISTSLLAASTVLNSNFAFAIAFVASSDVLPTTFGISTLAVNPPFNAIFVIPNTRKNIAINPAMNKICFLLFFGCFFGSIVRITLVYAPSLF